MDAYTVFWLDSNGTKRDISARAGNLSTKDDLESLSVSLSLDVQQSVLDPFHKPLGIMPGDRIYFYRNGALVLDGQVNTVNGNYRTSVQLSCYDDGIVLTKNDLIIQFNGIAASTAISQVCAKLEIGIGEIPQMSTKITKIYHEAVSSILQDILDTVNAETGREYFIRVMDKKLYVKQYADKATTAKFKQSSNLSSFPIQNQLGTASVKWSAEDLRNVIQIYSDQNDSASVLATSSDEASIARYGRRVKTDTYSDSDTATASQKARTILSELSRVSEEVSLHCYGSEDVHAGVALEFDTEEFKGLFLVKACSKKYGQPEEMDLTLRRIS